VLAPVWTTTFGSREAKGLFQSAASMIDPPVGVPAPKVPTLMAEPVATIGDGDVPRPSGLEGLIRAVARSRPVGWLDPAVVAGQRDAKPTTSCSEFGRRRLPRGTTGSVPGHGEIISA
jgi:hypothetical protein